MKKLVVIDSILERSGKRAKILIPDDLFHPAGGGQPGDSGLLEGNGFRAEVIDCHEGENGYLLSIVVKEGELSSGMSVWASVDDGRHWLLSRMHTGEHIFSRCLEDILEDLLIQKVWINETESTLYLKYPGEIGWKNLFEAEEVANRIITSDLPVTKEILSRGEAERSGDVKVKWDRVDDERIEVVSISGFDAIACSGSHVDSTGDVEGLLVTGFKGTSPDWEVRFTVDRLAVLERQSRIMRVLMREIGCGEETLPAVISKLKDEQRDLGKKIEKARNFICFPWERLVEDPDPLFFFSVENFPSEIASAAVRRKVLECPGSIAVFLSPADVGNNPFIIAAGEKTEVDLRQVIAAEPALEARGGGSPDWVQGVAGCSSSQIWKDVFIRIVDK